MNPRLVFVPLLPLALLTLSLAPGCAPARSTPAKAMAGAKPAPVAAPLPAKAAEPAPTAARPALPEKVVLDGKMLKAVPGGWKLEHPALEAIQRTVEQARAYGPGLRVVVNGYTSSDGTRAKNLAISHRRAQFVEQALIKAGLPPEQVVARGLGPDQPIAANGTREGRLKNQRVEIEFQDSDQPS
jgi:OOP family OmpA-OmpF porin